MAEHNDHRNIQYRRVVGTDDIMPVPVYLFFIPELVKDTCQRRPHERYEPAHQVEHLYIKWLARQDVKQRVGKYEKKQHASEVPAPVYDF